MTIQQNHGLSPDSASLGETSDQDFCKEARQTRIQLEGLRDDLRRLAEAIDNSHKKTEKRFDAFEAAMVREFAETRRLINALRGHPGES